MPSILFRNSEANASKCLDNIKEMFLPCYKHNDGYNRCKLGLLQNVTTAKKIKKYEAYSGSDLSMKQLI